MVKQLSLLDNPNVWASTKVLWKIIEKELSGGPAPLSIDALCRQSHYKAHTVRSGIQFLVTGGKISKLRGVFADSGHVLYTLDADPYAEWSRT